MERFEAQCSDLIGNYEMHTEGRLSDIAHANFFQRARQRARGKVLHANHADRKGRARGIYSPIWTSFPKGSIDE